MQQSEVTLQSLDMRLTSFFDTFSKFSTTVLTKFVTLEEGHQEVMEFMRDTLVTRSELEETESRLNKSIGSAKNEIMSYVDKKDNLYKGEIISSLRKEDIKIDQTITTLEQTKTMNPQNAERLRALGPFKSVTN